MAFSLATILKRQKSYKKEVSKPSFLREAMHEMKHVTWPKPTKILAFTGLVIIVTIVMAYFISFVDAGYLQGYKALRSWLNPGATLNAGVPSIETTGQPQILDADGNPVDLKTLVVPPTNSTTTTTTAPDSSSDAPKKK